MNLGKTIQIFLPDGNPRSIKIAEITSRTVQAILIPRSKLDYILTREELSNVGVYFLIGNPEEDAKRFHVTPGGIALVVPEMLGQQLHHVR